MNWRDYLNANATIQREGSPDYFGTIVIDEAHHCLSESYQRVLEHFPEARVLGVTATPERGDIRFLESRGFLHVGTWPFSEAKRLIDRIAGNNWAIPRDIHPASYKPAPVQESFGFDLP